MIELEKLLTPVSPENPCGKDPRDTGELSILRREIEVEDDPDTESGPDWDRVLKTAEGCLSGSKDLEVGVILSLALLKRHRLPGLVQGLRLLRAYVEQFWDSVHPRLDPQDPENDPTRSNVLASLSPRPGREGPYRFLSFLRTVPLSHGRQTNYSLRDLMRAQGRLPSDGAKGGPTPQQVEASFRDPSPASIKARQETLETIQAALTELEALEKSYAAKAGDGPAPGLESLRSTLEAMADCFPSAPPPETPNSGLAEQGSEQTAEQSSTPSTLHTTAARNGFSNGSIQSRQDVKEALEAIRVYYQTHEPSSPVPLLLDCAIPMVEKGFKEIMTDLPAAIREINKLLPSSK
jgi:type VI secretion system protein ImpA